MKRLLLLLMFAFSSANAQTVKTGLSRDTIRVGDQFRAVVQIAVPPGTQIVLPDSLTPTDDIENSGRMRSRRDSTAGGLAVSAVYPITAWRTGALTLPDLQVLLKSANGDRTINVKMPAINVVSVLPADTSNIQAKPPKDVIGRNWLLWPWIVLALVLLALAALGYWLYRKRKKPVEEEVAVPMIPPRQRALEELERIRRLGLAQEGLYKKHYTLVSEVVRQYMETVDPNWNGGLTTDELSKLMRGQNEARTVISMLRNADMVKFAAASSNESDALRDLDRARDWISAA